MSLLNSDFGVFSKTTGAVLQKYRSNRSGIPQDSDGTAGEFPFDPKILYDQHSGRFVAITLGGLNAPGSWVMIAVSSTSDPTGAWSKWAIDADMDNNVQTNSADFPGLGVDAFNVYVTANMFNGRTSQYSKVWVIPKAQLLSGSNPITWFEFPDPPGSDFTMQPAHTFGTAAAEYFLYEGSPNHLAVAWMDNTSGTPVWHSPLQVPVAPYTSTGSLPGAPQSGNDNTIDTSDTRLLNAVYRAGAVWAVHTVRSPAAVKTEVAWYQINPGAGAVLAQGRISDPNRWYYYPSIAVNKDNVAAIGFSGSSTTEYAGGYYTIIQPSSGTAEPVALLKAGEAPYWKTLGGTENRWGDFSATVVDPTDDVTFWTLQEYAHLPVSGIDQWGTWWGKFHLSDVLSPTGLTATADNATQVTLRWTDLATNETGYVVERKVGAAGTFGVLTSPLPRTVSRIRTTWGSLPVRRTTIGSARSVPPGRRIPLKYRSRPRDRPRPPEVAAVAADAFPSPDPEARCRSARRSSPSGSSSSPRAPSGCGVFPVGRSEPFRSGIPFAKKRGNDGEGAMIQGDPGARLSVTISNGMTVEVRLGQKEVKIGRGHEADLQLPDPSVSRLHAKVFRVGRQYFLADLRSRNGTHADGKRITQLALEDGRMFQVGPFRIHFHRPVSGLPAGEEPTVSPGDGVRHHRFRRSGTGSRPEADGSAHGHRRGAVRPDRRIGPCTETGRDDPPRRRVRRAGPDRGGNRERQGTGRTGDPRRLRAPGAPVHRRQLRGDLARAHRKRAVRTREGGVHRGHRAAERGVRTRQ